jgi:hypothetical protein
MNDSKINRFLKTYNEKIYQITGVSPAQMQENKYIEIQDIIDSIKKPRQNRNHNT